MDRRTFLTLAALLPGIGQTSEPTPTGAVKDRFDGFEVWGFASARIATRHGCRAVERAEVRQPHRRTLAPSNQNLTNPPNPRTPRTAAEHMLVESLRHVCLINH